MLIAALEYRFSMERFIPPWSSRPTLAGTGMFLWLVVRFDLHRTSVFGIPCVCVSPRLSSAADEAVVGAKNYRTFPFLISAGLKSIPFIVPPLLHDSGE